ncbi:MAG: PepSY domain-containing protein [Planctomycetaceae bacterium]|nr:PepSY domain-containing protein [Planctomycetaceae bacterium]
MYTGTKKMIMAVMAFAVLAGGAFAAESTQEARSRLTRQQAAKIAQEQVNGGRVVESEFNNRWFRGNDYDFIVVDENNRYDIRVSAETGEVLDIDTNPIFHDNITGADRQRYASATSVNPERIRQIAQQRSPNALITDMERSVEDGRAVYNVELVADNRHVDMKVDGTTGEVMAFEQARADRDNNRFMRETRAMRRTATGAAATGAAATTGMLGRNAADNTGLFGRTTTGALDRNANLTNRNLTKSRHPMIPTQLNSTAGSLSRAAQQIDRAADSLKSTAQNITQQARQMNTTTNTTTNTTNTSTTTNR